jgi:hypothetical protein
VRSDADQIGADASGKTDDARDGLTHKHLGLDVATRCVLRNPLSQVIAGDGACLGLAVEADRKYMHDVQSRTRLDHTDRGEHRLIADL